MEKHSMAKFYKNGESFYGQILLKWEIILWPNSTKTGNHSMAKFYKNGKSVNAQILLDWLNLTKMGHST